MTIVPSCRPTVTKAARTFGQQTLFSNFRTRDGQARIVSKMIARISPYSPVGAESGAPIDPVFRDNELSSRAGSQHLVEERICILRSDISQVRLHQVGEQTVGLPPLPSRAKPIVRIVRIKYRHGAPLRARCYDSSASGIPIKNRADRMEYFRLLARASGRTTEAASFNGGDAAAVNQPVSPHG
jgi:hypothetical protein